MSVVLSVLENTDDEHSAKRTCDSLSENAWHLLPIYYLCGDIRDGCRRDLSHTMDACITGTRSLRLFFNRTRRRKDVFEPLQI